MLYMYSCSWIDGKVRMSFVGMTTALRGEWQQCIHRGERRGLSDVAVPAGTWAGRRCCLRGRRPGGRLPCYVMPQVCVCTRRQDCVVLVPAWGVCVEQAGTCWCVKRMVSKAQASGISAALVCPTSAQRGLAKPRHGHACGRSSRSGGLPLSGLHLGVLCLCQASVLLSLLSLFPSTFVDSSSVRTSTTVPYSQQPAC